MRKPLVFIRFPHYNADKETRSAKTVSVQRKRSRRLYTRREAEMPDKSQQKTLQKEIRTAALELFRVDGLQFTMQQVADKIHISKKTIYAAYPSKEALLIDMVDDSFASIHMRKRALLEGEGDIPQKLRRVIIALPEEYATLDLRQMQVLDEKYPAVAARVRWHLETGWEPTLDLLRQGIRQGAIRDVSLPVLQTMITSSIDAFLHSGTAKQSGLNYTGMLDEMISILLEGLVIQ